MWRMIIAAWRAIWFGGWIEDWRGDFDNVNGAPYGWDDSEVPDPIAFPNRLQLDSTTTRHNRGQSLRAEIHELDLGAYAGNGNTANKIEAHQRAEVALGGHLDSEGDLRKYEWSTYFDVTYPTPDKFQNPAWQVFAQWHPDITKPFGEGTPSLQLHVNDASTMQLMLTDSSGVSTDTPLGDMKRGSWHDFSAEIDWSSNPRVGYVSIQVDGNNPIFIPGATMYPGNPTVYWKLGLYRLEGSGSGTATVYHDEAVRLRRTRRLWVMS